MKGFTKDHAEAAKQAIMDGWAMPDIVRRIDNLVEEERHSFLAGTKAFWNKYGWDVTVLSKEGTGYAVSYGNGTYCAKKEELLPVPPKPEHYAGERFTGEIIDDSKTYIPSGHHLEFTGEQRRKREGDWWQNPFGEARYCNWPPDNSVRWILRAVSDKPKFKVGDWAYCIEHVQGIIVGICKVSRINEHSIDIEAMDGKGWNAGSNSLRPLTDEDWTRKLGNVFVRAYEGALGGIIVMWSNGNNNYFGATEGKAWCDITAVPIMPPELSMGVYKFPEAK